MAFSLRPPSPERDAWTVLAAVHGLGPVGLAALLVQYGSGVAILTEATSPGGVTRLAATPGEQRVDGLARRHPINPTLAEAIAEAAVNAAATLERIRSEGIDVVTLEEPLYPHRLAAIALPPHLLFVKGDLTRARPGSCRRGGRYPPPDDKRPAAGGPDRRRPRAGRGNGRIGPRGRHRRRGARGRPDGRRLDGRGHRQRPCPAVPARAHPPCRPDRSVRRGCGVGARPRRRGDGGDLPAPEPGHRRHVGRHGRRRGARPQRRVDHRLVGARGGPRRLPRSGRDRGAGRPPGACRSFARTRAPRGSLPASRSCSTTSG